LTVSFSAARELLVENRHERSFSPQRSLRKAAEDAESFAAFSSVILSVRLLK